MTTKIRWTNETWNPTTGCSRVSAGCKHCYAEQLSLRFGWSAKPWSLQGSVRATVIMPAVVALLSLSTPQLRNQPGARP